ncbi:PKD domain-containing protein [Tenacibaculum sp. M341]|uniref:PKD domain-containing protein n=1 Tax=Tenacibaculum sp. M341 TaxID=2530339 RepID=UPI001043D04A|nr:PKD domain-containing protein [Tenacibaculum sp. M341]TCI93213.1 PKD domain-containing protein [Tenacibaculum sp. M341]
MNYKLEKLTTQYRKFTENQALTAGQLNEIIDFFEDQDRLSRTRLTGVGLACGFKTSVLDGDDDTKIINVTQGVGVTTDGDLVTLRDKASGSIGILGEKEVVIDITEKNYTHYREYETTKGFEDSDYPFFKSVGEDGVEQKVKLYELRNIKEIALEDLEDKDNDEEDKKNLFKCLNSSMVTGKVALLFLESFEEGETPCEDIDCDNQGDEQVSNLRMLLVSEDDVDKISQSDIIYKTAESYEALHKVLNPIEAFRAIISEDVKNTVELKEKFAEVVTKTNVFGEEEGDLGLLAGIKKVIETFNLSINTTELSNRAEVLFKASNSFKGEDFQYRYDLLKDLFATYNEIRSFILQLKFQCSPDLNAFPKHLLLGILGAPLNIGENTEHRHDFYKSPILVNDGENYQKLVFLVDRFEKLLQNGLPNMLPKTLKITPSTTSVFLGNRAIPFYYNTSNEFIRNWNFDKTKRGKEAYNLSYHRENLSSENFIQKPLNYSLDGFDFFRIEGHIGKDYKTAYEEINSKRIEYGLPFKIKVLSLNEILDSEKKIAAVATPSFSEDIAVAERAMFSNDPEEQKHGAHILSALRNRLNNVEGTLFRDSILGEKEIETELLSEYLCRNSGLEHAGGVELGGTFVLLYYTTPGPDSSTMVVADFSVPYVCCTKKEPVLLAVPVDKVCEYEEPIQISVIPEDAEVTTFVKEKQINAITKVGEQNYFNPILVPSEHHEKVITFQVNEEAVAPQITVYPEPNISIVLDEIVYNADERSAMVTFEINSTTDPDLNNLSFEWSFGDGERQFSTGRTFTHTYKRLPANEDIAFNVEVIAINTTTGASSCQAIESLLIDLFLIVNELDISVTDVCDYDDRVLLEVLPVGAEVKAYLLNTQINAIEKEGEQQYFVPRAVPSSTFGDIQEITFTVNNDVMKQTIKVYPKPDVNITSSIEFIDGKDEVIVTYKGLISEYEYEFDFSGNGFWEEITPDATGSYSKTYVLTSDLSEINTKIRVIGENSCVNELVVTQKFNEGPTVEDNTLTLNFSTAFQANQQQAFNTASFVNGFTDPNGDSFETVRVTALPSVGELLFNGNPVTVGYEFPVSDSARLTYSVDNVKQEADGIYIYQNDVDAEIKQLEDDDFVLINYANGVYSLNKVSEDLIDSGVDGTFDTLPGTTGWNSDVTGAGWENGVGTADSVLPDPANTASVQVGPGCPPSSQGGVYAGAISRPTWREEFFTKIDVIAGETYIVTFEQVFAGDRAAAYTLGIAIPWVVTLGGVMKSSTPNVWEGFGNQTWQKETLKFVASTTGNVILSFRTGLPVGMTDHPDVRYGYLGCDNVKIQQVLSTSTDTRVITGQELTGKIMSFETSDNNPNKLFSNQADIFMSSSVLS